MADKLDPKAKSGQKPDHKATAGKKSSLAAAATAAAWKGAKSPEEAEAELRRQAEIIKNIKNQFINKKSGKHLMSKYFPDSYLLNRNYFFFNPGIFF